MEIVVRAVVLFCFLRIVTRVVGRSTLGELSTFQLLLSVTWAPSGRAPGSSHHHDGASASGARASSTSSVIVQAVRLPTS